MNPLKSSRGARFLAAGAAVAAIGLGSGGWAFAASSGHAPTLTPVSRPAIKVVPARPSIKVVPAGPVVKLKSARPSIKVVPAGPVVKLKPAGQAPIRIRRAGGRTDPCSGLSVTPVTGVPAPPVPVIENPTPVPGTPVVCGDGGTTGTTAG